MPSRDCPVGLGSGAPTPLRPGQWPYLWIDATYVKVREAGRIVSVAVTIAVAVNTDGRREVLGMAIGASEAETFWVDFLRRLKRRGLAGVRLVISDAHEGIKAAVARVFRATWQRCRVHFMRNALAHAGRSGRRVVAAFIATAFAQDHADAARAQWRQVADQVRPKLPKLAALLDEAEEDVLAYMSFPKEHRAKLHSTDEIDKSFVLEVVCWCGTGDRVANSGAAAASSAGLPDQMPRPQVRRPCAGWLLRVVIARRSAARRATFNESGEARRAGRST